ncbi:hypothetical protein IWQ62_003070 [Dispira parvispora]|uniref:Uncharacterized protein n=1 Tax=Dispira parvispora TaxID=1520584 RepID=A0A9W8APB0_9FUNG|nr:hypothetical protein IWQ62_003070 [Dispira parvispora]
MADESDAEYEIESILGQKQRSDGTYYLVKWANFPLSECTWEHSQNVATCPSAIRNFKEAYRRENALDSSFLSATAAQTNAATANQPLLLLLRQAREFFGIANESVYQPPPTTLLYRPVDDPTSNLAPSHHTSQGAESACQKALEEQEAQARERFSKANVIAILERSIDRFGQVRIQVEWSDGSVTWEPLANASYFPSLFEAYEHRRFMQEVQTQKRGSSARRSLPPSGETRVETLRRSRSPALRTPTSTGDQSVRLPTPTATVASPNAHTSIPITSLPAAEEKRVVTQAIVTSSMTVQSPVASHYSVAPITPIVIDPGDRSSLYNSTAGEKLIPSDRIMEIETSPSITSPVVTAKSTSPPNSPLLPTLPLPSAQPSSVPVSEILPATSMEIEPPGSPTMVEMDTLPPEPTYSPHTSRQPSPFSLSEIKTEEPPLRPASLPPLNADESKGGMNPIPEAGPVLGTSPRTSTQSLAEELPQVTFLTPVVLVPGKTTIPSKIYQGGPLLVNPCLEIPPWKTTYDYRKNYPGYFCTSVPPELYSSSSRKRGRHNIDLTVFDTESSSYSDNFGSTSESDLGMEIETESEDDSGSLSPRKIQLRRVKRRKPANYYKSSHRITSAHGYKRRRVHATEKSIQGDSSSDEEDALGIEEGSASMAVKSAPRAPTCPSFEAVPWNRYTTQQQEAFAQRYSLKRYCTVCIDHQGLDEESALLSKKKTPEAEREKERAIFKDFLVCRQCMAPYHVPCLESLVNGPLLSSGGKSDSEFPWVKLQKYIQFRMKKSTTIISEISYLPLRVGTWTCFFCDAQIDKVQKLLLDTKDTGLTAGTTRDEHGCAALMHRKSMETKPTSSEETTEQENQDNPIRKPFPDRWYLAQFNEKSHWSDLWLPFGWLAHVYPQKVRGFARRQTPPVGCVEAVWYKLFDSLLAANSQSRGGPHTRQGFYIAGNTDKDTPVKSIDLLGQHTAYCCLWHVLLQRCILSVTHRVATVQLCKKKSLSKMYPAMKSLSVVNPLIYVATDGSLSHYFTGSSLKPTNFIIERILDVEFTTDKVLIPDALERGRLACLFQVHVKWEGMGYDQTTWEKPPGLHHPGYPEFVRALEAYEKRGSQLSPMSKHYVPSLYAMPVRQRLKYQVTKFKEVTEQPQFISHGQLFPYQLEGLNWLCYQWSQRRSCILADEMGLGKTIQIVCMLNSIFHRPVKGTSARIYPFLIVVPKSLLNNWVREFRAWAPNLVVVPYYGNAEGLRVIRDLELYTKDRSGHRHLNFHVLVTTYHTVVSETTRLKNMVPIWPCMIIDEGHCLKNDTSQIFTHLKRLDVEQSVILTGTPLQNNVRELFNLMSFVDEERFGNVEALEAKYQDLTADQVPELHDMLKPYFLRRTKTEVLTKLVPGKDEVIVPLSMTPLQQELYRATLGRNHQLLSSITKQIAQHAQSKKSLNASSASSAQASLTNILMRLRQILDHPYILPGVEPTSDDPQVVHQRLIDSSAKLKLLHTMLPVLRERGHRVLIFSQMTKMLDILEDFLIGETIRYLRLDGSSASDERQRMVDLFNAPDSPYWVFMLTTRAGGMGLNLTAANVVILYDVDFNPHADQQAISRAHRIGQTKDVMAFKLVTRNSAEERIVQLGAKKMALDHVIIERMDQKAQDPMDLESILQHGARALFEDELAESSEISQDQSDKAGEGTPDTTGSDKKTPAKPSKSSITYSAKDVCNLLDKTAEEMRIRRENQDNASQKTNAFGFSKVWVQENPEPTSPDVQTSETGSSNLNKAKPGHLTELSEATEDAIDGNDSASKVDAEFWDKVLKSWHDTGAEQQSETEKHELGRGRRVVKRIDYKEAGSQYAQEDKSDTDTKAKHGPNSKVEPMVSGEQDTEFVPPPESSSDEEIEEPGMGMKGLPSQQEPRPIPQQPLQSGLGPLPGPPRQPVTNPGAAYPAGSLAHRLSQSANMLRINPGSGVTHQPQYPTAPIHSRPSSASTVTSAMVVHREGTNQSSIPHSTPTMTNGTSQASAPANSNDSVTGQTFFESLAKSPMRHEDVREPPDYFNFRQSAMEHIKKHPFVQSYIPCPVCKQSHQLACTLIYRRKFQDYIWQKVISNPQAIQNSQFTIFCNWYRVQYGIHLTYINCLQRGNSTPATTTASPMNPRPMQQAMYRQHVSTNNRSYSPQTWPAYTPNTVSQPAAAATPSVPTGGPSNGTRFPPSGFFPSTSPVVGTQNTAMKSPTVPNPYPRSTGVQNQFGRGMGSSQPAAPLSSSAHYSAQSQSVKGNQSATATFRPRNAPQTSTSTYEQFFNNSIGAVWSNYSPTTSAAYPQMSGIRPQPTNPPRSTAVPSPAYVQRSPMQETRNMVSMAPVTTMPAQSTAQPTIYQHLWVPETTMVSSVAPQQSRPTTSNNVSVASSPKQQPPSPALDSLVKTSASHHRLEDNICALCGEVFPEGSTEATGRHLPRKCPLRNNVAQLEQRVKALEGDVHLPYLAKSNLLATANIYLTEARLNEEYQKS